MGRGSRARTSSRQHPPQEGLEGGRGHLVRGDLLGLGVGPGQPAAQVDEVEVEGDGGVQLQGVALPGRDQVADLEHLGVGEFVDQAPEVVQGPAEIRGKFRGSGVHQVQGQNELGHLLQGLIDRGVLQVGFPGRLALQQFRHPSLRRCGRRRRPP